MKSLANCELQQATWTAVLHEQLHCHYRITLFTSYFHQFSVYLNIVLIKWNKHSSLLVSWILCKVRKLKFIRSLCWVYKCNLTSLNLHISFTLVIAWSNLLYIFRAEVRQRTAILSWLWERRLQNSVWLLLQPSTTITHIRTVWTIYQHLG